MAEIFDGILGGFGDRLQGAFTNPLFNLGLGLLTSDDIGSGLVRGAGLHSQFSSAAADRETQRLKNEAAREQLLQQSRARDARNQIFTMMGNNTSGLGEQGGVGVLSPETLDARQTGFNLNDNFGLFAEAYPDQAGTVLADQLTAGEEGDPMVTLGNGSKVRFSELPSDAQMLVSSGLNPGSEEFSRITQNMLKNGDMTEADMLMAKANATMAQIEARREARDERGREFSSKNAIKSTFSNIQELAKINDRLRGTMGETGLGMDELRQAAAQGKAAFERLTGIGDATKTQQVLNDIKRFETLALKENVANIGTLKENLGGRVTQFEFEKYIDTGPSPTNPADTNAQILADQLEDFRSLAEFEGVEVPEWVGPTIRELRNPSKGEVGELEFSPKKNKMDLGDGVTLEFE